MKELTYILGAGASYQSIPIVKTFPNRFAIFANQKLEYCARTSQNGYVNQYITKAKDLFKAFYSHQSFDTYFKKLFHNGLREQIEDSKKILNMYFVWEHLTYVENSPESNIFWKQSNIDKRYDALIAGLLKPHEDKVETFTKVNFITWNYDLNLFCSLKNYFAPEISIKDFLEKIQVSKNIWVIENQVTVINMNGFFYSSLFNNQKELPTEIMVEDYLANQFNDNFFENKITCDSELIKFAWENNEEIHQIAKAKISKSNNVVVIGYTFPLYNRLIDLEYLSEHIFDDKIKVVVQDSNAVNIKATLHEMLDIFLTEKTAHYIEAKTDCDNFYIPSNIYTKKDSGGYETILFK